MGWQKPTTCSRLEDRVKGDATLGPSGWESSTKRQMASDVSEQPACVLKIRDPEAGL